MKFSSYIPVLAVASTVAGQVMLHPNMASNKCLEVRGDVLENNTPVQIFDCNGTPAQLWDFNSGETLVRLADTAFCIDAGSAPVDGTQMKIFECFPNLAAQTWFTTADDRIALFNQGLCLDLPNGNTTNANVVQVFKCTDGDTNQVWISSAVWLSS